MEYPSPRQNFVIVKEGKRGSAKLRRISRESATKIEEYVGLLGNGKRTWLISHKKFIVDLNRLQRMLLSQRHVQDRRTGCKTAREERAPTRCHCAVELLSCAISSISTSMPRGALSTEVITCKEWAMWCQSWSSPCSSWRTRAFESWRR